MSVGSADGKTYDSEIHAMLDIPSAGFDDSLKEKKDSEFDTPLTSEERQTYNQKYGPDANNEPKKIYFVRHGDTDLNSESNKPTDGNYAHDEPIRGWSDVSLNAEGRKHAQKAAEGIKDLPIEHIVSSDLPRAKETARIIGNKNNIPVEYDSGLRTWDLGAYTEQTGEDVHKAVDRLCTEAQDERPPVGKFTGESFNEFKDRILGAVSGIVKRHNDKEILIVSHNSPERVLHAWTEAGQPQKHLGLDPDLQGQIEDRIGEDFHAVEAQEAREAAARRQHRKIRYPGLHGLNPTIESPMFDPSDTEMELDRTKRPFKWEELDPMKEFEDMKYRRLKEGDNAQ